MHIIGELLFGAVIAIVVCLFGKIISDSLTGWKQRQRKDRG